MTVENLKFPIGPFEMPREITAPQLKNWILEIEQLPEKLQTVTEDLSVEELNYVYRPDGWNIKQVIHHLADSHMNSLVRFKLTLTEETPTIKPYQEHFWAELIDGKSDEIESSMLIIKGVHSKWSLLLNSLTSEQLERKYYHPENKKEHTLLEAIAMYAWHCNHHLAHIKQALEYKGKFEL
ncbi:MAG: putative metal-dependent hydrolase [Bacteroidota bacterium]